MTQTPKVLNECISFLYFINRFSQAMQRDNKIIPIQYSEDLKIQKASNFNRYPWQIH